MDPRMRTGRIGEQRARAYLVSKGMRLIGENWRCRAGEIDLIAEDGNVLVFVEVRTRTGDSGAYGTPLESVNTRKQRQIRKLAELYLKMNGLSGREVRFDVVSVRLAPSAGGDTADIEHVAGAF